MARNLTPLEERLRGSLGQREHAAIELEPGELAVGVEARVRSSLGASGRGDSVYRSSACPRLTSSTVETWSAASISPRWSAGRASPRKWELLFALGRGYGQRAADGTLDGMVVIPALEGRELRRHDGRPPPGPGDGPGAGDPRAGPRRRDAAGDALRDGARTSALRAPGISRGRPGGQAHRAPDAGARTAFPTSPVRLADPGDYRGAFSTRTREPSAFVAAASSRDSSPSRRAWSSTTRAASPCAGATATSTSSGPSSPPTRSALSPWSTRPGGLCRRGPPRCSRGSPRLTAYVLSRGLASYGPAPVMIWPTAFLPGDRSRYHALALQAFG